MTNNPQTISTWKLTGLMIKNQWAVYTLYFLFSLLIFAEQLAPGLIVKTIFDHMSGEAAQSNVTFLWGTVPNTTPGIFRCLDCNPETFDDTPPVPEPASMLLLGTGLLSIGAATRRRFSRKQ